VCDICGKPDVNNPCISCENWGYRIKSLNEDKTGKLVAFKGFVKGQRVLISNAHYPADTGKIIGRIYLVDIRRNLLINAEHYLIDVVGDSVGCAWYYPEQVELADESASTFVCKSCHHERLETDRHNEHICKGCAEYESEGYVSCWFCWRTHDKSTDIHTHKCLVCSSREKENLLCQER
jgi:hypothetical protein